MARQAVGMGLRRWRWTRKSPGVRPGLRHDRRSDFISYYFLRASLNLSPGLNSEAPLDVPVVRSFFLSPGENSEAPRVVEVELCISVPGAELEAPLPDEPAKLRLVEPIRMAAAVTIKVLFTSFSCYRLVVVEPNAGRGKRFCALDDIHWKDWELRLFEAHRHDSSRSCIRTIPRTHWVVLPATR